MNSISGRDSLLGRCLICSDGSNRCASQSANSLQKSSRQQYSAVISIAIEELSRPGFDAQCSQADAVKALVFWEAPQLLSGVRVNYSSLCGNRRLSQFVEKRLGFFQIGG